MKTKINFAILIGALFTFSNGNAKEHLTIPKLKQSEVVQAEIKIYLLGGIVSVITQKEIDFGKKYHVVFLDFGCVPPTNLSYYEEQNYKSFDLLNIQFGPKWQEELKPTTLGFKKWKEKNK